jgi:shikimate 5-dehydrogenase
MGARFTANRILEWTKTSGIVIASCEYEDHQNVRDCIYNATTVAKYAQKAQLCPHGEIFGKDQVLRDVKFYVTDGSITVNKH